MSIRINPKSCVGCARCSEVCPGGLINIENAKAVIKYPKDCWGCVSCVKECRAGAIEFYLAEDMGGNGTYMKVEKNSGLLDWNFYNDKGKIKTITVDPTNSNKY